MPDDHAAADATPPSPYPPALLRIDDVLARVPVGRSTWLAWVRAGFAPAPAHPTPQLALWHSSSIDFFVARIGRGETLKGFLAGKEESNRVESK